MPRKSKGRTRKGEDKTPPKRMLILCEGQTEEVYFKGFVAETVAEKKLELRSINPNSLNPKPC